MIYNTFRISEELIKNVLLIFVKYSFRDNKVELIFLCSGFRHVQLRVRKKCFKKTTEKGYEHSEFDMQWIPF